MSITFKGLVASLVFATSIAGASAPAKADVTLASLGLDQHIDECDLKLTRRALWLDVSVPENLDGLTDLLCGCRVVTDKMLEYIRRHRTFELILAETDEQCPGFARVLSNVSSATILPNPSGRDDRDRDRGNGGNNGGDGGDNGGNGGDNGGNGGDNGGNGGDNGWDHDHDWDRDDHDHDWDRGDHDHDWDRGDHDHDWDRGDRDRGDRGGRDRDRGGRDRDRGDRGDRGGNCS